MKKGLFKRKRQKRKPEGIRIVGKTVVIPQINQSRMKSDGQIIGSVCFPCVFIFLILIGNLLNFCRIFDVDWQRQWVFSMIFIAAACVAFVKFSQKHRLITVIGIGFLVATAILSWSFLCQEYAKLGNLIIREWNDYYGTNGELFTETFVNDTDFAIFYVMAWMGLLLAYFIIICSSRLGVIVVSASAVILGLLVGNGPNKTALIGILCGAIPAVSYLGRQKIEANSARIKNGMTGAFLTASLLFFSLLLTALLPNKWEDSLLVNHDKMMAYQQNLERQIMSMEFPGINLFGKGWQESGYVTNKYIRYTEKEIFTVRLTGKPEEKMYFRGFVGTYYKNGRWFQPDTEAFSAKAKQWINNPENLGIEILNQSAQAALAVMKKDYTQGLRLEYTQECGNFAYIPYFFIADNYRGYALSAYADTEIRKPEGLKAYNLEEGAVSQTANTQVVDFGDDSSVITVVTSYVSSDTLMNKILPQEVLQEYKAYAEREYTKTTNNGLERLNQLANKLKEEGYGVQDGDVNYAITISKVIEELHSRTNYNRKLGLIPMNTDVVENFLFESNQGYCIHYASAATILLQKLGVPARYVTGYAVNPDEFQQSEDGGMYKAVVPDSDGHAWVEVYDPRMGWIPVEVTKGSNSMNYGAAKDDLAEAELWRKVYQEAQQQAAQMEETEKPEVNETETSKTEKATEQPLGSGGDVNGAGNTGEAAEPLLSVWQILFIASPCLILGVYLSRYLHRYRKKRQLSRKLNNKDTRIVLLEASHAIYEQLLKSGMLKEKNLPDEIYTMKASGKMNFLGDGEFEKFMECVKRCAFTDYVPTAKEAAWARSIYKRLRIAILNQNDKDSMKYSGMY